MRFLLHSPIETGFVYLAVIIDAWSRRVVGYASRSIDARLAIAALKSAIRDRYPPKGCIHHSNRRSQYASADYRKVRQPRRPISGGERDAEADALERQVATIDVQGLAWPGAVWVGAEKLRSDRGRLEDEDLLNAGDRGVGPDISPGFA